jgi:hypothetical protein
MVYFKIYIQPGVNVMITIFGDFGRFSSIFSEEKGVFLKINVLFIFSHKQHSSIIWVESDNYLSNF